MKKERCEICGNELWRENGGEWHDCQVKCEECHRWIDGLEYTEHDGFCEKCFEKNCKHEDRDDYCCLDCGKMLAEDDAARKEYLMEASMKHEEGENK